MQACGRLVARMGEQDVDRDIAADIEIDGGDMALVMGDLDDPAIDDRYVAARQIGLDIGRNVVTIAAKTVKFSVQSWNSLTDWCDCGPDQTRPQCWPATSKPSQYGQGTTDVPQLSAKPGTSGIWSATP